jgi:ribosomal protein S18 acetylase RimI-like enzyme
MPPFRDQGKYIAASGVTIAGQLHCAGNTPRAHRNVQPNCFMSTVSYQLASLHHAALIVSLVNSAYRGEISKMGWTTEAHILGGQRTDEEEIQRLLTEDNSLILLCYHDDQAIGTVHLKKIEHGAYLGMLTIKPELQGQGYGKQFLAAAEQTAQQTWGVNKITLSVITLRHELIAFYQRRGYQRTGILDDFPQDPRFGIPRVAHLQFEYLEKILESQEHTQ